MYFVIRDTNGATWRSDASSFEEFKGHTVEDVVAAMEELEEVLQDFTSLTNLSIVQKGDKIYFNPRHIVSAGIIDKWTREDIEQGLTALG